MPWLDVIWTEENERHIAEHGLTCDEVEFVIHNPIDRDVSETSGRPIAFGYSRAGRKIAVVYEVLDGISVCPITAYEVL